MYHVSADVPLSKYGEYSITPHGIILCFLEVKVN